MADILKFGSLPLSIPVPLHILLHYPISINLISVFSLSLAVS